MLDYASEDIDGMDDDATVRKVAGEGFRRTPTWRAKCRISGSGRPSKFDLWVHAEIAPPTYLCLVAS